MNKLPPEFQGCEFGPDDVWGITWSNTEPGYTDTQPCPGGVDVVGNLQPVQCEIQELS